MNGRVVFKKVIIDTLSKIVEPLVLNNSLKKRSITLNNFLHRIDCKTSIIELVTQKGCSLKRIRRSKNWSLIGTQKQLLAVSEQLQQARTVWIRDVIHKALPKPSFDLTVVVQSNPDMTINRLIAETGCTLIEARSALDKAEDLA